MPEMKKQLARTNTINIQFASLGSDDPEQKAPQLVAIPLLTAVADAHGEKGNSTATLQDAPVESMIAAPEDWCPNPKATVCLRVRGNSMMPLIYDGYIVAVDTAQAYSPNLDGKLVLAWHTEMGLMVSRLQRYDHTEVLLPENKEYESIVMDDKHNWKILAKVLWWIGKAP